MSHFFSPYKKSLYLSQQQRWWHKTFSISSLGSTKVIHVTGMTLFSKCPVRNPQCPPCSLSARWYSLHLNKNIFKAQITILTYLIFSDLISLEAIWSHMIILDVIRSCLIYFNTISSDLFGVSLTSSSSHLIMSDFLMTRKCSRWFPNRPGWLPKGPKLLQNGPNDFQMVPNGF